MKANGYPLVKGTWKRCEVCKREMRSITAKVCKDCLNNKYKKKRNMKKPKKSTLKKKADALFSLWMRKTIPYCQAGGLHLRCSSTLQNAHIVTRGNMTLRYHSANCLVLCSAHHFWFHRYPLKFVEMIIDKFPEKYKYVQEHKNTLTKMTIEDYQNIIKLYEK